MRSLRFQKHPAPAFSDEAVLLDVRDLRTSFETPTGRLQAVDRVSLTLERGQTLGVVGESGCGKSVLSRSVMGLLPGTGVERSGEVLFGGTDLVPLRREEVRRLWGVRIAMVFQDPATALSPVLRVGRQLTDGLRHHHGLTRGEARARAVELLASVGLPEPDRHLRQYPHQLSGGMRQRVVLAIALACRPRLLLADEPTTALDVTLQAQILDLLSAAQSEQQLGMVLVSHDLGVVGTRTDEIAVMYAGRIVERAPTKALFSNTRMPYTEALIGSIPRREVAPHSRLAAIPGRPPDLTLPRSGCAFAPRCPRVAPRCRQEEPELRSESPGHAFACWYPVGRPAPIRTRAVEMSSKVVEGPMKEVPSTSEGP